MRLRCRQRRHFGKGSCGRNSILKYSDNRTPVEGNDVMRGKQKKSARVQGVMGLRENTMRRLGLIPFLATFLVSAGMAGQASAQASTCSTRVRKCASNVMKRNTRSGKRPSTQPVSGRFTAVRMSPPRTSSKPKAARPISGRAKPACCATSPPLRRRSTTRRRLPPARPARPATARLRSGWRSMTITAERM